MKQLTIGILAHVDSGKTTLCEGMLYTAGVLRRLGRVDHGSAFLDTDALERERGITIFSKQAVLDLPEMKVSLLDTPGHIDFSAEMERTLQVLDYAVLVVSGSEGVQSHTETLWKLLGQSGVPTFLFINKMDLAHSGREELMEMLRKRLDSACVDFTQEDAAFYETLGSCDEALMEQVIETGCAADETIARAVSQRHVFPCCFGSALKLDGVPELLTLLQRLTLPLSGCEDFSARVYKISEDAQGKRLTHMKISGGVLRVRDMLTGITQDGTPWQEKVSQIRVYSGAAFQQEEEVRAGMVCAVTGLSATYSGEGLGTAQDAAAPVLEPILRYSLILPEDVDLHTALAALRKLEQEEPLLRVAYSSQLGEIQVLLMGEMQAAVLQHILAERFGIRVDFAPGGVAYKETISNKVEGVGHYEPLRHYAEVRLILEPGKPGSGLQFSSICREDALDRNWQRLILAHLAEKQHLGVLTGSPITDMKITLAAGRAHKKHTEGGDFRQATYRAVRQGLMQAQSVLLEPWYHFRLELPTPCTGRAITDLQRGGGRISPPHTSGEMTVLEGEAPAALLMGYPAEVTEYTGGRGRLSCTPAGYAPCADAEAVVAGIAYNPEADPDNSPDSVFCSHGAGHLVKWQDAAAFMHTESVLKPPSAAVHPAGTGTPSPVRKAYSGSAEQDRELMKIFEQTYGSIQRKKQDERHLLHTEKQQKRPEKPVPLPPEGPEYLIVDGYNIIFAWDELKALARDSLDDARARLLHILSNYCGYRQCELIVVFDAYRVKGNPGSVEQHGNLSVVYTKEAETADTYIERITHELGRHHRVRVATSDGMEQLIILGNGAYRVSAAELLDEVRKAEGSVTIS